MHMHIFTTFKFGHNVFNIMHVRIIEIKFTSPPPPPPPRLQYHTLEWYSWRSEHSECSYSQVIKIEICDIYLFIYLFIYYVRLPVTIAHAR